MEVFWAWFTEQIEKTEYYGPIGITLLLAWIAFRVCSNEKLHLWTPIKFASVMTAIGLSFSSFILFVWKSNGLYLISGVVIAFPWFICILLYLIHSQELRQIVNIASPEFGGGNMVDALRYLRSIPPKHLTKKQRSLLSKHELLLFVKLGNIKSAEAMLENFQKDRAFYAFVKHLISYMSGNMVKAKDCIKQAENTIQYSTDKLIRTEILLNHGVSYVTVKNYPAADEYFEKAAASYKMNRLNDPELLSIIYSNRAMNLTRIHTGDEAALAEEKLIAEYEAQQNPKKHTDLIRLFNLKLEVLRQLNKSREEINALAEEAFDAMMKKKMPVANQCMFAVSCARIVWAGCLNPEPCLNYLDSHLHDIDSLAPSDRYFAYKELNTLFADLHGPGVRRHIKIKERAEQYRLSMAENDLRSWQASLPNEAVLARCSCLVEMAGIQRYLPEYDAPKAMQLLNGAIDLYKENGLHIDELLTRLHYIDELCAPENADSDFIPLMSDEMLSQLHEAEALIPTLAEHPMLIEIHIRMGFYCSVLDQYDDCLRHYQAYKKSHESVKQYAPWIHRYLMVLDLVVRTVYFSDAVKRIQTDKQNILNRMPPVVKDWFNTYPSHDGFLDAALLGKFIGYDEGITLKYKCWIAKDMPNTPQKHVWLTVREFMLDIDITSSQFSCERMRHKMFFAAGKHPFESGRSDVIQESVSRTGIDFQTQVMGTLPDQFPSEMKDPYEKIYSLIVQEVAPECPTVDEIKELFKWTMLPVDAVETTGAI